MPARWSGWIALGLAGLPACADPSPRPTDSTADRRDKDTVMTDPLRALDRHPALTITIRQGTEHFADGVVTLTVRGDGAVTVEQRRGGQAHRHGLQLDAARVAAIGGALADHRLTAPRTTSLPREPGDTRLILRVDGGATPFEASLWYGDRYQDRDLDAIIRLADGLVHEATGGQLGQATPK